MEKLTNQLIDKQKQILYYYSPYNFIRDINPEIQFNLFIREKILSFYDNHNGTQFIYKTTINEIEVTFLYQYLLWDTEFFKKKCF